MGEKPWAGSRDDLRGEREKQKHRGVPSETCVGLDAGSSIFRVVERRLAQYAITPTTATTGIRKLTGTR